MDKPDVVYLYHLEIQLVKSVQIINELKAEGWMYITSFSVLENPSDPELYQAHLTLKVRMLKDGITKWIFIDAYGNLTYLTA